MLDQLTLADLLRVIAWAFFSGFPLFIAYGMGNDPEKKDEAIKGFLFWLCFGSQLAFGLEAYIAGQK